MENISFPLPLPAAKADSSLRKTDNVKMVGSFQGMLLKTITEKELSVLDGEIVDEVAVPDQPTTAQTANNIVLAFNVLPAPSTTAIASDEPELQAGISLDAVGSSVYAVAQSMTDKTLPHALHQPEQLFAFVGNSESRPPAHTPAAIQIASQSSSVPSSRVNISSLAEQAVSLAGSPNQQSLNGLLQETVKPQTESTPQFVITATAEKQSDAKPDLVFPMMQSNFTQEIKAVAFSPAHAGITLTRGELGSNSSIEAALGQDTTGLPLSANRISNAASSAGSVLPNLLQPQIVYQATASSKSKAALLQPDELISPSFAVSDTQQSIQIPDHETVIVATSADQGTQFATRVQTNLMQTKEPLELTQPVSQPAEQQEDESLISDSTARIQHLGTTVGARKQEESFLDTLQQASSPLNRQEIVSQIVDRARLTLRPAEQSEMVMRLRPEHLGELTLKVSVENGLVSATFHSDNHEVRQAIEASLPQLKQELSQQGIKLDNVGVFSGSDQFFDNGQKSPQQQQSVPIRKNPREFLQAIESADEIPVRVTDGVDYRI